MGTTAQKLQAIVNSKAAIKAAIEEMGVSDVGDVLSTYPDKIRSIKSGKFTGHADVEGLKAIGWTDEDIAYFQEHGVNWDEEEDKYHKVSQDNIDLYGVVNATNISTYKASMEYLPKIDTSGVTSGIQMFASGFLVAIPMIDTSNITNMYAMFQGCINLTTIPQLDTSNVTLMNHMFQGCKSLNYIPPLDTSKVTTMERMFDSAHIYKPPSIDASNVFNNANRMFAYSDIQIIPMIDLSKTTYITDIFIQCYKTRYIGFKNLKTSLNLKDCMNLQKECLLYIINNEAAISAATITLSANCYNKYSTDPEITAALAAHPKISLASA